MVSSVNSENLSFDNKGCRFFQFVSSVYQIFSEWIPIHRKSPSVHQFVLQIITGIRVFLQRFHIIRQIIRVYYFCWCNLAEIYKEIFNRTDLQRCEWRQRPLDRIINHKSGDRRDIIPTEVSKKLLKGALKFYTKHSTSYTKHENNHNNFQTLILLPTKNNARKIGDHRLIRLMSQTESIF